MMTRMMSTMQQQQSMLKELQGQHTYLAKEFQQLKTPTSSPPTRPPSAPPAMASGSTSQTCVTALAPLPIFTGDPENTQGFITQCSLFLHLQAAHFLNEEAQVAYIITRLCGHALDWATALLEEHDLDTSEDFLATIKQVFCGGSSQNRATRHLLSIKRNPICARLLH